MLDRFELSEEARRFIAERLWVGASLIVSDEGISNETGAYTDFIVLTHLARSGRTDRPTPPALSRSWWCCGFASMNQTSNAEVFLPAPGHHGMNAHSILRDRHCARAASGTHFGRKRVLTFR